MRAFVIIFSIWSWQKTCMWWWRRLIYFLLPDNAWVNWFVTSLAAASAAAPMAAFWTCCPMLLKAEDMPAAAWFIPRLHSAVKMGEGGSTSARRQRQQQQQRRQRREKGGNFCETLASLSSCFSSSSSRAISRRPCECAGEGLVVWLILIAN